MSVRLSGAANCLTRTTGMPAFGHYTAMMWIFRVVDNTVNAEYLISLADSAGFANYIQAGVGQSPSDCYAQYAIGGSGIQFGATLALSTWYHVAMVFDDTANTLAFFLDGVQTGSSVTGITTTTTWGYEVLGNFGGGGDAWMNGRVAYYRSYLAVLTGAEILAERTSPTPVRTANLHRNTPLTVHTNLNDTNAVANWTGVGTLSTEADPPAVVTGPTSTFVNLERTNRGLLRGIISGVT